MTGSVPTLSPVGPQRTQLVTCRLSVPFGFDFLWGREDGVGGAEAGESQAVSHNTNSLSSAPLPILCGQRMTMHAVGHAIRFDPEVWVIEEVGVA